MFLTSKMLASKAISGEVRNSVYFGSGNTGLTGTLTESDEDFRIGRSFMTDAYRVNPWIRAIVDDIKERFDQVEVFPIPLDIKRDTNADQYSDKVKKHMETVMRLFITPNDEYESFSSLKKKYAHDVLVYDEAGIQIVKDDLITGSKVPAKLYANVSGEEIYVNTDKNGLLMDGDGKDGAFLQIRGNTVLTGWNKMNFMNFIKNRRAGYINGMSPIESIAASIMGDLEALNYNLKFFENNARPNLAFLFQNLGFGPGQTALERAKKWYYQEHKGKPHLPLFMGTQKGEVTIQQLTVPNKDMEFNEWGLMLLSRIMAVYGMQPMVLGVLTDTTGKLNSQEQGEQFKKNAIIPLVKLFCNTVNSTLVWGDSNLNYDDIYLTSANLDIDDESKQAQIWETFLQNGVITINQVREELQMPPVPWGKVPFVPLNMSPIDLLRRYQESQIKSNLQRATSPKIDNNVGGATSNNKNNVNAPVPGNKPAPSAKKDIDDEDINYMLDNFDVPTGLENIDSSLIVEAASRLISKKDSRSRFFDMSANSIHNVVKGFDLEWKNILQKK
jgi:HK97 family phage portal protein